MRARVETVIRDEAGNILSQLAPHEIDLKNQSLYDIEGAVEAWKRLALPEIEASLLTEAQKQFTQEIKKTRKPIVTAHDLYGLRRYTESSCFLYKNIKLMHEKPTI